MSKLITPISGTENISDIPFFNASCIPRNSQVVIIGGRRCGKTCLAKYILKKRNLRRGLVLFDNCIDILDSWMEKFDVKKLHRGQKEYSYVLIDEYDRKVQKDIFMMHRHFGVDLITCAQSGDLPIVHRENTELVFFGPRTMANDIGRWIKTSNDKDFIHRLCSECDSYQFIVYDIVNKKVLGKTNPEEAAMINHNDEVLD
jgi:ABC-type oligopeptide transport system ATPase subunit